MPYKTPRPRPQGEPDDLLHRAAEQQQRELVGRLAIPSGPEGIATLVRAFADSRTSRLRCYILDALRTSEDPRVTGLVEAGLADGSPSTRCHAIEALLLRRPAPPDACRLLLPLLRDPGVVPRCRATEAAAGLGCRSPEAVAELLRCSAHAD